MFSLFYYILSLCSRHNVLYVHVKRLRKSRCISRGTISVTKSSVSREWNELHLIYRSIIMYNITIITLFTSITPARDAFGFRGACIAWFSGITASFASFGVTELPNRAQNINVPCRGAIYERFYRGPGVLPMHRVLEARFIVFQVRCARRAWSAAVSRK